MSRSAAVLALVLGALEAATGCGESRAGSDDAGAAARSAGSGGASAHGGDAGQRSGGRAGASGASGASRGGGAATGGATTGRAGVGTAGGEGGEGGEAGGDATARGGSSITITGGSAGQTCTSAQATLTPAPPALYLMLDVSGSMLDPSGSGAGTKWQAMKTGVMAFLDDSSDLTLALGYFPRRIAGVPDSCTADADCGAGAPCLTHVCQQTPGMLVACTPTGDPADLGPCTDAVVHEDGPCITGACRLTGAACQTDEDCRVEDAALGQCFELGVCDGDPTLTCSDTDPAKNHPGCGPNGTAGKCLPTAAHFCLHETDCDPSSYAEPALDFPATASAVKVSLDEQTPRGDSPARTALHGAIAHARAWRAEQGGGDVAVVLATDGVPTDCSTARAMSAESSAALDDLVAEAAEGFAPVLEPAGASVRTFVLGVLGETDLTAATGLTRVAEAGGTEQAYILAAEGNIEQELLAGLRAIRDSSLGCRLAFAPEQTVDTELVLVALESGDGSSEALEMVPPEACSATSHQWHFDTDPTTGRATGLELCPATCDFVRSSPDTQITVVLPCRPPLLPKRR